jgi:hypothetical protein
LFVHGFTGGNSTWENKNGSTFPEALQKDKYIADSFDIATYEYFTTLFDLFAKSKEKYRFIKDIFMGRTHKKEKNLDIQNLSNNLSTHLRFSLAQYEKIYVIAHSMGGLIVKSLIINELKKKGHTKIRLFASLAVPHLGANVATLLKLISTNIQIDNLNPTCEFIGQLNQSWVDLTLKPTTKYFYGSCDEYVTKTSAIAIDNVDKDIISVDEDHSTIAKPENEYSVIVLAIVEIIKELHEQISLGDIGYQRLESDVQYVDELFVIKLIVADIPADTVKNVKELFFNAEYARKLLKSKHNKKRLEVLFDNIRQLYRDSYDKFLSGEPKNSGLLLAEVHEKISMEDSNLLKSMMEELKVYHKKGMLHQLANDNDSGIWWTKDKEILLKSLGD